ncbi:MAG: bifunctional folylpolyglutamate synthase/dihydrofolate synthase, partial [Flavobacteriaceae bacterium]|nr:bifunctional folylpolyglutamate synthase/dihydrofolate synthase [Flavobacteriaceae bacterium]
IKVNGLPCSEDFVVDFIAKHSPILQELRPSFFEMTVAMAFQYFKEQKVDIAIIEVGLGGRLDSTNIISPILSVITNISKDHTAMLGNTLEEIATEKAGIIKENTPVVIGEFQQDIAPIFKEKAENEKATILFADQQQQLQNCKKTNTELIFDWQNLEQLHCPLYADYQIKNINTALTALACLKEVNSLQLSEKAIREGVEKVVAQTQFQGRWQVLGEKPLIICETGHNEAGIRMAMQELAQLKCEKTHIIIGVSNDKDLGSILPLFPKNATYYFTQAQVLRAMPSEKLQENAKDFELLGNSYDSVAQAIEMAKKQANPNDFIYIGGSIFVVAEAI